MTTKIFLKPENSQECYEYFVHDEHEADFCDFLKNHENKSDVSIYTSEKEGVEWFTIELTSNDVENIKDTCWYPNTKWDNPDLDEKLVAGTIIEVFSVDYIPKGE